MRLPVGRYYSEIETAKGLYATYVVAATTGEKPYRIHTRGPSFPHIGAINKMAQGHKISDLVTIMATLDPVIPEIDYAYSADNRFFPYFWHIFEKYLK